MYPGRDRALEYSYLGLHKFPSLRDTRERMHGPKSEHDQICGVASFRLEHSRTVVFTSVLEIYQHVILHDKKKKSTDKHVHTWPELESNERCLLQGERFEYVQICPGHYQALHRNKIGKVVRRVLSSSIIVSTSVLENPFEIANFCRAFFGGETKTWTDRDDDVGIGCITVSGAAALFNPLTLWSESSDSLLLPKLKLWPPAMRQAELKPYPLSQLRRSETAPGRGSDSESGSGGLEKFSDDPEGSSIAVGAVAALCVFSSTLPLLLPPFFSFLPSSFAAYADSPCREPSRGNPHCPRTSGVDMTWRGMTHIGVSITRPRRIYPAPLYPEMVRRAKVFVDLYPEPGERTRARTDVEMMGRGKETRPRMDDVGHGGRDVLEDSGSQMEKSGRTQKGMALRSGWSSGEHADCATPARTTTVYRARGLQTSAGDGRAAGASGMGCHSRRTPELSNRTEKDESAREDGGLIGISARPFRSKWYIWATGGGISGVSWRRTRNASPVASGARALEDVVGVVKERTPRQLCRCGSAAFCCSQRAGAETRAPCMRRGPRNQSVKDEKLSGRRRAGCMPYQSRQRGRQRCVGRNALVASYEEARPPLGTKSSVQAIPEQARYVDRHALECREKRDVLIGTSSACRSSRLGVSRARLPFKGLRSQVVKDEERRVVDAEHRMSWASSSISRVSEGGISTYSGRQSKEREALYPGHFGAKLDDNDRGRTEGSHPPRQYLRLTRLGYPFNALGVSRSFPRGGLHNCDAPFSHEATPLQADPQDGSTMPAAELSQSGLPI
ncbi:hypothetical protein B0H19DRAFT_1065779 [Mycena capillaripes]|nr:hypothetical protein B0H19DRAFT_1065779 [Mycena capillaripes]